jgi:hypothetical protein
MWTWIKSLFSFKNEIDPHAEYYLNVPESDVPVHKPEHCSTHNRFRKSCPACKELVHG